MEAKSKKKGYVAKKFGIEEDAATLVGKIVEKGTVSGLVISSAPKPSVLPFPVARHRSHGPHWAPLGSEVGGEGGTYDNNDDDDDEGHEDYVNCDPLAAFANPMERKKKRGLDFSKWREIMSGDYPTASRKKEADKPRSRVAENELKVDTIRPTTKTKLAPVSDSGYRFPKQVDNTELVTYMTQEANSSTLSENAIQRLETISNGSVQVGNILTEKMEPALMKVETEREQIQPGASQSGFESKMKLGQRSLSLESEIDAENCARLQSMSPEEIAEAQAEIMQKMDPALLKLLRKRGQEKMKNQASTNSDQKAMTEDGIAQDKSTAIKKGNGSSAAKSNVSDNATKATSEASQRESHNAAVENFSPASPALWNVWSERVEAVRNLRFSLEGDVIENGNLPLDTTYTVDNVSERDFLRTEGNPGAAGYTIKEAVALTRSVMPGQRALALHLLASVLDKALCNIQQKHISCAPGNGKGGGFADWEAIWAFALGPEPELALTLRICLDDNHNSVILACAKVIHSVLSCDANENFFEYSEKMANIGSSVCTAPVFRSKPEIDVGFLHGGFWKYNTKPSNVFLSDENVIDESEEGEHTVKDDVVVSGQDVAAGFVRMGILPRICYLLEMNPSAALEELLFSILIAIARHSPTGTNAIMKCPRLVQTIVSRFTRKDDMANLVSKMKSVTLLKVLAQSNKRNCLEFIRNGIFQQMTWHLYRQPRSLEQWVKLGNDIFKLESALMIEQLRFWRVCIQYGCCISYFSDLFPALCLWLNLPTFEKLAESNVLNEFASTATEAYLVLDALAGTLPDFSSNQVQEFGSDDTETWCWNHVPPMVDLAVKWLTLGKSCMKHEVANRRVMLQDASISSLLWVMSAVLNMLATVIERVALWDAISKQGNGGLSERLPEFVLKIAVELIKSGLLSISGAGDTKYGKGTDGGLFIEELCRLRHVNEWKISLASVCCLRGLTRVTLSICNMVQDRNNEVCQQVSFLREDKMVENVLLKSSLVELKSMLDTFTELVASDWQYVQAIEVFGRGGPAPGIGLGWGASCGGFWSLAFLLAEADAWLLIHLLEIFPITSAEDQPSAEEMSFSAWKVNAAITLCLTAGPRDRVIVEKALDYLLQLPVLKCLDICARDFLLHNRGTIPFSWVYKEEDFLHFSNTLASHFKSRWLCMKKSKAKCSNSLGEGNVRNVGTLDTIPEDLEGPDMRSQDLVVEWAHQRLPLPMHWFLSPISTISDGKGVDASCVSNVLNQIKEPTGFLEVAKAGLFFLLCVEAMSSFLTTNVSSPVKSVSLTWKLHSLSAALLVGMGILEVEKSRDTYVVLQEFYGKQLDKLRRTSFCPEKDEKLSPETRKDNCKAIVRFQSEIHESYYVFLEALVEQFAAISYGDLIYGRQVAIYLHRHVETPVRLAAWNALSNARVLELLPPLESCCSEAEGYLEPVEDNEGILEAYVKSWVSGALDKAATRGSVAFRLVLHHLSSFIFNYSHGDKLSLQHKLARSLLRDYSRKKQHEGMMVTLICYKKPEQEHDLSLGNRETERRFRLLVEACEGNSTLLTEVDKLKSLLEEK
ncbi:RNA polymerase II-associated protein 1, N-terminal [Dillenia turbinata]|uniref:RNA polymerase II-associated protein 1, N-terminal n=1 Tax=Dillenia turbinata TaxID=194707 RepID=A0AAN8UH96_9MAGN